MERKFKHQKTGEIISYKDGVIKSGSFVLEIGCEPSKEYWEEMTDEKDYEILSFIDGFEIFIKQPNGIFKHQWDTIDKGYEEGWNTEKYLLKIATRCKIHSVRRLSDNFVITLGDYCKAKKGLSGEVTTIEFCGNGELRIGSDKRYYVGINDVVKSEVLFRTKDNVAIEEGDKVYGVSINWNVFSGVVQKGNPYDKEEWKHGKFSTEEAAKEYILWNKPVLSLKDVASIYPGINKNHNTPSHQAEQLKELVKSKL